MCSSSLRRITAISGILLLLFTFGHSSPAQVTGSGTATGQSLSLGSTWTRSSRFAGSSVSAGRFFRVNTAGFASPRFFGGVTVGRGFYPYYTPPWFAYEPYGVVLLPGVPCGSFLSVNGGFTGSLYGFGDPYPGYPAVPWDDYFGAAALNLPPPDHFAPTTRTPSSQARLNDLPPVDFGRTFRRPSPDQPRWQPDPEGTIRQVTAALNRSVISGEFPGTTSSRYQTTSLDRIEGLRLQTRGDQALQQGDLELARTFYQAAVQAMPERQAAWLRMAWVYVFQRNYSRASAALNRALACQVTGDSAWISAHVLLNAPGDDHAFLSDDGLWKWLQQLPESTDRILLTAGFQFFLGHSQTGTDLLQLIAVTGTCDQPCSTLAQLTDRNVNDRRQASEPLSDDAAVADDHSFDPAFSPDAATGPGTLILPPAATFESQPESATDPTSRE